MSDDAEWGPWVQHDGAMPNIEYNKGGKIRIHVRFLCEDLKTPQLGAEFFIDHPCWFWRWRRVRTGWFTWERRRVCDDPAYSPILAYRVRRPRGMVVLQGLLESLPDVAPAGGAEVVPIKARPRPKETIKGKH